MAKVHKFDTTDGKLGYIFKCPGCKQNHLFTVGFTSEEAKQLEIKRRKEIYKDEPHQPCPIWGFNGDPHRPSFTPSMLVTWKAWNEGPLKEIKPGVCHSFVSNGMIQFLADCTHALAGQTVSLPDMNDED